MFHTLRLICISSLSLHLHVHVPILPVTRNDSIACALSKRCACTLFILACVRVHVHVYSSQLTQSCRWCWDQDAHTVLLQCSQTWTGGCRACVAAQLCSSEHEIHLCPETGTRDRDTVHIQCMYWENMVELFCSNSAQTHSNPERERAWKM